MKKILIVGLVVLTVSLAAVFAVPAFANGPGDSSPTTPGQDVWQAMHEACEEGDWEAMDRAADEVHQGLGYAPCHDYQYPTTQGGDQTVPNGWGGMMGGSHMGGGGGMMAW